MYWKLKAKHGLCGAHLLRDLAEVALVAAQTAWAAGLAALLVEVNAACDDARRRGLKQLAPAAQRAFAARYDALVAQGLAANPAPANGRKRGYYERRSHNLVCAFRDHRRHVLRYMYDLEVGFTNNQAERDLRPHEAPPEDLGVFPQPARRRALRSPTQLPVHHPQARPPRHRSPHSTLQGRPMDATRATA